MQKGKNRAVFLDRDGTINIERNYLYKISDFEYLNGAVEGLRELTDRGYQLVVITNQSGIARGYYTEEDYLLLDKWMCEDLHKRGVKIAKSYYCPHLPEGIVKKYSINCICRKPKTGMYWNAVEELDIDMDHSFAIGDKIRDLSICKESGVKGILLSDKQSEDGGFSVCKNWPEIIDYIVGIERDWDLN